MTKANNPLEENDPTRVEPSPEPVDANFLDVSAGSNQEDMPATPASLAPANRDYAPTTTTSPSVELAQLLEAIQGLSIGFQNLQQGFDSKIKYDASKERVIDTLHKELQTYREGLHFQILRPIFFDLIAMHDDLGNLLKYEGAEETASEAKAKLRQSLESFQYTIEGILERHGVEVYNIEGEEFVTQRQRAIKTINTDIPEKDKLIAERLRKGFAYEGKTLRPEIVTTFKFQEVVG